MSEYGAACVGLLAKVNSAATELHATTKRSPCGAPDPTRSMIFPPSSSPYCPAEHRHPCHPEAPDWTRQKRRFSEVFRLFWRSPHCNPEQAGQDLFPFCENGLGTNLNRAACEPVNSSRHGVILHRKNYIDIFVHCNILRLGSREDVREPLSENRLL